MLEILFSKVNYEFLDQPSYDEIEKMRKDFSIFAIQDILTDRPLLSTEKDLLLNTFTGTRINRTIQLLLNIAGIKSTLADNSSSFEIEVTRNELIQKWDSLIQPLSSINDHITNLLMASPSLLDFSKWGLFLPVKFQVNLMKNKYYDIEKTEYFLKSVKLINN